jgi:uncharacterized protein YbcC (UPF0753/DUF2309 family)/NADH:ubiquinone oxidoreductase subunit 5 (subunit L)/multisubunit Na+/H+ antiporter MnhA subunit
MKSSVALLPLLAPLGLLVASLFARRDRASRPRLALGVARAAATLALAVAALTGVVATLRAPLASPLWGHDGLGFCVRIDGLSAVMLALVAILGAAVVHFSRNYLAGDRRQGVFVGDLSLTIACVMILVVAGNLVQLVVGWIATSLALHRLLLFYPDRRGAVVAAHKKFIVARLGDACLVGAAILLVRQFGSGDIGAVLDGAAGMARAGETPASVHVAAILIGLTAFFKAAQFPAHGWLIEMQETPTPVSALLHAGILNGGTFLVVRLAGVVELSTPVLVALVVVGGFTAVFASVVMLTDARMKATLAYSSAAHMGFMLLLCGIGATSVAIAHLVAHSFYKAHAFLSSGSAVEAARVADVPGKSGKVPALRIVLSYVVTAAIVWGVAAGMGFAVFATPTNLALASIMVVALSHLMAQGASGEPSARVIGRTALSVTLTALSFYALDRGGGAVLAHAVPEAKAPSLPLAVVMTAVVSTFGVVTWLQLLLPRAYTSPGWTAAYVFARNGLYANAYFDHLIGATKLPAARRNISANDSARTKDERARPASVDAVKTAVHRATHAVAPVWPLATFVAVNPFHGLADRTVAEAAYTVARTAGARMTMPRRFYLDAVTTGRIHETHIAEALAEARAKGHGDLPRDVARVIDVLRDGDPPALPTLVPTVADVVSELTGSDWGQILTERFGAWAATYFDEGQASWPSPWKHEPPYEAFRREASLDATPEVLGARGFRAAIRELPDDAAGAAVTAIARLGVPEAALEVYLHRLLGSIGGWAAYARRRVWERELQGEVDTTLEQVLSIRLAWEVALLEAFASRGADAAWSHARATLADDGRKNSNASGGVLSVDLVLQAAYEKGWQESLVGKLAARAKEIPSRRDGRARVQAAFCIDVRSEVFRRALEAAEPECETIGFAGFFGFPVEYVPLGQVRGGAQCPVLLTSKGVVVESVLSATLDQSARAAASRLLDRRARRAWKSFKTSAISCFGFVGPVGLAYLPKLLTDSLGVTRPIPHPSRDGVDAHVSLGPDLSPHMHGERQVGLTHDERVAMAEGLLRGMSLTSGFARLVMLTGHGSTTVNNPHSASLDCGACGGHTGEANARIAAMVLNEPTVRAALAAKGIDVPGDTVFLGALHDTTTDLVTIFDRHAVPASHAEDLERLDARLAEAGVGARRLRAPLLGEDPADASAESRILSRGRDWAQVRPEWGLAGCAAFIVAPRHRTAGVDLGGRSFLHSYDWRADERAGFPVLEQVMTAPMVVGSWISLQYYASTVDNRVYGCGNKVLHNVVGTIGVLEGNGGDLRVGLPWQSVHDGERLVHEPMRLHVVIEAPIAAMNAIIAKHASVRALLDNGWLHLYALGDAGDVSHRYMGALEWEALEPARRRDAA